MDKPLSGKVVLVAGATRGAGKGIATEMGAAGATVYVTGRSTRDQRSEYDRDETIEQAAEAVTEAGGTGIAVQVDHLEPARVKALAERVEAEQGHLDVLVNNIWGGEGKWSFTDRLWEHDLDKGLRVVRLGIETHLITSHFLLPLLLKRPGGLVIEMNDGTEEYNRANFRNSFFFDIAKSAVGRMGWATAHEIGPLGATALSLTPGWMRSEMMLDNFGVTEETWRDALDQVPHFAISETPRFVGRAAAALAADPDVARWNGKSTSSGELAGVYGFTDLDGSRPDAWRYIVEVQDAGKPADTTGYR
ncbi:SDR family oxidoreductase [Phytomonospora endophytica]|uniref:NAD(P)-dependent dehydrogenase (Short-subunit alcohol dehydrogenase family) n=1 Tax=Phytomonospora endophytica TaxID=714109 RepID=A0A841G1Z7_9ACTN|nr:SDR family oxidoreductase [Phytomonospora endophytica]MBB6039948.1 NAD(P)-dependent dehydrogenase (short-subunit alcohol dehydrogenase family) [Phytomonospora endophytica]GIG70981.1 short-chain dehydrogenase [Phytomonospora endophytica]